MTCQLSNIYWLSLCVSSLVHCLCLFECLYTLRRGIRVLLFIYSVGIQFTQAFVITLIKSSKLPPLCFFSKFNESEPCMKRKVEVINIFSAVPSKLQKYSQQILAWAICNMSVTNLSFYILSLIIYSLWQFYMVKLQNKQTLLVQIQLCQ